MRKQSIWYLGCLALLIAVATYTLRQPKERGMQRMRLGPLQLERIDDIELSGATTAQLHKEGDIWRLRNGRAADAGAIERFLHSIDETVLTDFVTDDADEYADLGVEGAKATAVRLSANGREKLRFSFVGDVGPGMQGTVLRGRQVFRGDTPFAAQGTRAEADWLDRHLFDLTESDVAELTVALHGEAPYTLARSNDANDSDRSFALQGGQLPAKYRFDPAAAGGLLNTLLSTSLQEFVTPTPEDATSGLGGAEADSWCLVATAATGDGAAVPQGAANTCLLIGKAREQGEHYAKLANKPDVFLLPASQVDGLKRRRGDFRALDLMAGLNFDDVIEAGIEQPKARPMRFAKSDDGWAFTQGKPKANFVLDKAKLNARLRKMTHARAIGIAAAGEGKMLPSSGKLWLKTKDGKQHALQFGAFLANKEGMRSLWVRGTADDNIYRMSKPLYDDLMAETKELAQRSASAAAPAGLPTSGGQGLDSLPPDVRANIERQLAQQGQQG